MYPGLSRHNLLVSFSFCLKYALDSTRYIIVLAYDPVGSEPLIDFLVTDFRLHGNFVVRPQLMFRRAYPISNCGSAFGCG